MYKKVKEIINLKNLANIVSSLIVLFAIIWFLFGENFSFFESGYIRHFKGFQIISFNANYYYKHIPVIFSIFSILLFASLLFVFFNTIIKIFKKSNIGKLLKYVSAVLLLITTIMFHVTAWHEEIIGPSGNGTLLFISLYISSLLLLTYDGIVYIIKEYKIGSTASKEAKGYYIVSSIHKVLTVEENIKKKFYSLSKSEKYIKKIEKENHTNIKIEKH